MAQSELPNLFGRITLVLGDHTDLRSKVESLRAECAALRSQGGPPAAGLVSTVKEVAEQVLTHFAVEEKPEYFGALVEESPELREPIAELKQEHAAMRELLAELTTAESGTFGSRLERFLAMLGAHERKETALLEAFFRGEAS